MFLRRPKKELYLHCTSPQISTIDLTTTQPSMVLITAQSNDPTTYLQTGVQYGQRGATTGPQLPQHAQNTLNPTIYHLSEPPRLLRHRSPFATIPLPSKINGDIVIHPVLEYTSAHVFRHDLRSHAWVFMSNQTIMQVSSESATTPPLSSLTLIIPDFPWPIVVHGTTIRGGRGAVSVGDVLWTLHREMNLPAGGWVVEQGLMGGPPVAGRGTNTSAQRVGLRRLDYLGDQTTFVGLSYPPGACEALIAHVS